MTNLSLEERAGFIKKMETALMPLFSSCVVPIFGGQNGAATQCGTGTLFRVAGVSFLVTAAHVADIKTKHHIDLYVTDSPQGSQGVPLEGKVHFESNLDVAVVELKPELVKQLPNRKFLTVHHADRANRRITKGTYYIHGYPNCWSDPRPQEKLTWVKPFTYATTLYEGYAGNFDRYNEHLHVLLAAPEDVSGSAPI
jgi:hypothetical protein